MIKRALQRELSRLLRVLLDEDRNHSQREKAELEQAIQSCRRAIRRLEDPSDRESEFDTREERDAHYYKDE